MCIQNQNDDREEHHRHRGGRCLRRPLSTPVRLLPRPARGAALRKRQDAAPGRTAAVPGGGGRRRGARLRGRSAEGTPRRARRGDAPRRECPRAALENCCPWRRAATDAPPVQFSASRSERDAAKRIIQDLAKYSPADEPAAAFYADGGAASDADAGGAAGPPTLAGKWTLLYTDAPDITSLDGGGGPFPAAAKLGRIGQECAPPSIKNVIEWRRPDWAASFPFGGDGGDGDGGWVLQKVCCEGRASRGRPASVDLTIAGLELSGVSNGGDGAVVGPARFLEQNPVTLRGPLTAPFGRFDILYLDEGLRITQTSQGYYAVNVREETAWF